MMKLQNGKYATRAGSTVTISGEHSGIAFIEFDWLEEGACIECTARAYPERDGDNWLLLWDCEECGGGSAELASFIEEVECPA